MREEWKTKGRNRGKIERRKEMEVNEKEKKSGRVWKGK